jgi:uncharacterized protein (DUF1697 family)
MALVVLLKGVNVGGHRTFQPSVLAKKLAKYDVVNIGAAGTFVVRKAVSRTKLRAELKRLLPFVTDVMICGGAEFMRIDSVHPFAGQPADGPKITHFVSTMAKRARPSSPLPFSLPATGDWDLKILAYDGLFIFGMYRRHMKAIGHLGKIEPLFGVPVTTRNWNTTQQIIRILKAR